MVPKLLVRCLHLTSGFRAVLFRMVPKLYRPIEPPEAGFRAVLFRMVPKQRNV